MHLRAALALACIAAAGSPGPLPAQTAAPRYVIADQDAAGPGGSDMAALLVLLQSPRVDLLGITVVTGDGWRDAEVAHTLRLLELVGRTDVKVYPGAATPLVRTRDWTRLAGQIYGKATYLGAWGDPDTSHPDTIPTLPEGNPTTLPATEDAAHFMIRMVHLHPHQVTIYAAGPLTDVALAIRLDPAFPSLAEELVVMGGSLNPRTEDPEWADTPRHEFNFWFDPEAASITLAAPFPRVTVTTVDASIQTHLHGVLAAIANSRSPAAQYLTRYATHNDVSDYAWDELAAATWLDPAITTRSRDVLMDVDLSHGPGYGDTLTYTHATRPALPLGTVHAQVDVDATLLERDLVHLFTAPTPHATHPDPFPPKP